MRVVSLVRQGPCRSVDVNTLRWFVAILGPLVLVSYVVGILRADDPQALWGGVSAAEQKLIVPFMFVAAAGFLGAAYILFFKWTPDQLAGLHWPGQEADGNGMQRLLWAYALYLIPSALWLESTLLHLNVGATWTQALVILVLSLVSVGLFALGALAIGAMQDGYPAAGWLLAGVIGMVIQSTINDNIIWVIKFPW